MHRGWTLQLGILGASALLLGILAAASMALEAPQKKIEIKGVATKCLACHGSYDKIRESTAKYKASSGEVVTPHQYVPHKAKGEEKPEIPDCTECHEEHPMSLTDKSKVVKPKDIEFCFSACHHMSNLDNCNKCH